MNTKVFQALELANQGWVGLSCVLFAHLGCLLPTNGVIHAAHAVVATFPADCDGGIVAGLKLEYKAKVSIQAA